MCAGKGKHDWREGKGVAGEGREWKGGLRVDWLNTWAVHPPAPPPSACALPCRRFPPPCSTTHLGSTVVSSSTRCTASANACPCRPSSTGASSGSNSLAAAAVEADAEEENEDDGMEAAECGTDEGGGGGDTAPTSRCIMGMTTGSDAA